MLPSVPQQYSACVPASIWQAIKLATERVFVVGVIALAQLVALEVGRVYRLTLMSDPSPSWDRAFWPQQ